MRRILALMLTMVLTLVLVACEGLEPPAAPREPVVEEDEAVLDTLSPDEGEAPDVDPLDVDEPVPDEDEPVTELEQPLPTTAAVQSPVPVAAATEQVPTLFETDPADIWVAGGLTVTVAAQGLSYVGDVSVGPGGELYVAEVGGHTYGTNPEAAPEARILEIRTNGERRVLYDNVLPLDVIRSFDSTAQMPEGLIPPITGLTLNEDNGLLYVSHRGRYSVLNPQTGAFETIINGLPVWGEFLNHKPIFGPDGRMVFVLSSQGNSGTVDGHMINVMEIFNKPMAREIPCEDVTLTGLNFEMDNSLTEEAEDVINAGVYLPLGVESVPGMVIPGEFWCHGAIYSANPDGTDPRRIAWGLRSVYGLDFSPAGRLVVTQNSGNVMQPRPIYDDWETIYEIEEDGWYGWPDYYSGLPIVDERFTRPNEPDFQGDPFPHNFSLTEETRQRLTNGSGEPIQPLVRLPVHAAAEGMVFGKEDWDMDPENEVLVAEFGAIIPFYDEPDEWPGFRVQKVNLTTGEISDFMVNRSGKPAWAANSGGLRRPLQLAWGPDGALYVADFGVIRFDEEGMTAEPQTGVIWKVQPVDTVNAEADEIPPMVESASPDQAQWDDLPPLTSIGVRGADGVLVSATTFVEMEITGPTGDDVGTVGDLLVDSASGRILYVSLQDGADSFLRELGDDEEDEGVALLPLSAFAWDDDSDNLPLAIDIDIFTAIPSTTGFAEEMDAEGGLLMYWNTLGLAPFPAWLEPDLMLPISSLVELDWGDEDLGTVAVTDLLVDLSTAQVRYLLLSVAGDDRFLPVPWSAVDVALVEGENVESELVLALNVPAAVLADAPRLAGDVLGNTFAPTFDNAIAWYWQRAGYPLGISGERNAD